MPARPAPHPAADVLVAFGQGKLEDTAAGEVMTHLDSCPQCCQAVAEASGDSFLERLRAARGTSGTPVPASRGAAAPRNQAKAAQLAPTTSAVDASIPPELRDHPQYEVVRELGRGGMGVVYLATNKLMQRPEVLKVMNKTLLDRGGAGERFLREIRAAARLNHPNVATAYTALQVGDLLVFAMEYVEGENLAQVVKARGPLPVVAACYYVQQAALGLQHAFENAMVHRDIKPQNLMVTRRHKRLAIKVLDFGLAKVIREQGEDTGLTGEGKMLGTPDYVAPEQIQDAAHADIRADIYSLGGTLYYLLSGGPPFREGNLWGLLQAHMSRNAEPLNAVRPEVPVELAAVVAKMLAKDPAERYQTPVEVAQALLPFVKPRSKSAESSLGERAEPEASKGSKSSSGNTSGNMVAKDGKPQRPAIGEEKPPAVRDTRTDESSTSTGSAKSAEPRRRRPPAPQPARRTKQLIAAAGAASVLLLVLIGLWAGGVLKVHTKDGIIVLTDLSADTEVTVDGETAMVRWGSDGKSAEITAKPGMRNVVVTQNGVKVTGKEVEVEEGGKTVFNARIDPTPKGENEPGMGGGRGGLGMGGGMGMQGGTKVGSGPGMGMGGGGMGMPGGLLGGPGAGAGMGGKPGENQGENKPGMGGAPGLGLGRGGMGMPGGLLGGPGAGARGGAGMGGAAGMALDHSAIRVFTGHKDGVRRVLFTPDGSRLISGSNGNTVAPGWKSGGPDMSVRVWNLASGKQIRHFDFNRSRFFGVQGLSVSPNGQFVAACTCWEWMHPWMAPLTYVWEIDTGVCKHSLALSKQVFLPAVTFSGDAATVRVAHSGKQIVSWSLANGAELGAKDFDPGTFPLSFTANGALLLGGDNSGNVWVWDANTGKKVATLPGHSKPPLAVAVSKDGTRLLSTAEDYSIRLWEMGSGKELACVKGLDTVARCVALSPDGTRFVTGDDDGIVRLWDAATGKELTRFTGHTGRVNSVAVSPDGKRAVSGGQDTTIRLWQLP